MYPCEECTAEWSSKLAADLCAERDRDEADDRANGRLYGIYRALD